MSELEDKRKERNKKYYEKKKEKVKESSLYSVGNFIDFKLDPKAKPIAVGLINKYKDIPDFLHSLLEYLEVEYHSFYKKELKRLKDKEQPVQ